MIGKQQASTRVLLNTIILYVKLFISVGISLYSTRLVLNALGSSDYGIFNLVAGVIAMLSFLNAAMTVSTQRYLSFHQGTGDLNMQKKIFSNSWILHIAIGIIILVLLLILAPVLFGGFLNIPIDSVPIARVVYYFMSVSVFFTILSVPFTATLNARENMLWIAIVNIIESIIKLAIAFSLLYFLQSDRLMVYGLLMASLSIFSFILYTVYCIKKYNECSIVDFHFDKLLIKELSGFAGWNLFGNLCYIGKNQGIAVVMNIFLGTIINAAYGIANQVASQLNFFSITLLRALNPQIMKSEGMKNRGRMLRLSMIASKFGFFLFAIIAIPCMFEMPMILKLWLKEVPEFSAIFCVMVLLARLINQLVIGLESSIQSTGKIKLYQSVVGSVLLFNLPVAFFLLKMNYPPYYVLIGLVFFECVASCLKLFFAKKIAGISIKDFFKKVILKEAIPVFTLLIACWAITNFFSFEYRILLTLIIPPLLFLVSFYFFGLCADEKTILLNFIGKFKIKMNIR